MQPIPLKRLKIEGLRKSCEHLVYGFLTISPNAVVEPINPKAMPAILTTDEEGDTPNLVTLRFGRTCAMLSALYLSARRNHGYVVWKQAASEL